MPTMKQANHSIYLAGQGGEGIDVTPDGHRTGADGRVRRGGSVRPEPALLEAEEGTPVVPSSVHRWSEGCWDGCGAVGHG